MKRILLLIASFVSYLSVNAQGGLSCGAAYNLTTNGTYTTSAISGAIPTGTGLCFTNPQATPTANWFKFTPAQGGVMTITSDIAANPANADTRLSILTAATACTSPWTCVAANDDVDGTNYRSAISNFSVTAGTTYYIIWDDRWETTSRSFDFIFTPQTCFKPTGFTYLAPPTTTSVNIGWTAPASGTPIGYDFEYGPQGFTQGTGTTIYPTGTSANLTLSPSTVYEFYIRTNCGSGDYSVWEGPIGFNTVFEPANAPYNTGFENTSFNYLGWFAATAVTGNAWSVNNAVAGDPTVQEGASSIFSLSSTTTATNSMVISRGVNLVAGEVVNISFYALNYRAAGNTTSNASFEVYHGASQTAAAQTNLIGTEAALSNTTYALRTYTFTPSSTGVYYFGIKNTSPINTGGAGHGLILDNFTVTQTLSTEGFDSSKLLIYPNPVNNLVNITNTANIQINKVSLTDVHGRIVKSVNAGSLTDVQINVSELNSGVYFMNIETNEGSATKKIVKQ